MHKYNLYGYSDAVVKHQMIEKVFEVRERKVVVPGKGKVRGKVRRKVCIVSCPGFRELRQEACFGAAAIVRFFLTDDTNRSQGVLRFDVC